MISKIEETKKWLDEIIINLNICPFAKTPYKNGLINITLAHMAKLESSIQEEIKQIESGSYSTSLVILDENISFEELLSTTQFLTDILNKNNEYQFIVFHPDFVFDNLIYEDRANYVNRSPFPIIHILMNSELDNLLETKEAENLSLKNEQTLNSLSIIEFKKLFYYL